MSTIKAPYNFVPFNKEVVSPHWIEQISHDIPFADGLSGKIEVQLKAETPIFVRDGVGQKQAKDSYTNDGQQSPHLFSQYSGKYFIPGTSLKGMIRNVLEILSFGRMGDKVTNDKYSLRDLSGAMKDKYLIDFKPDKIYCGWLKREIDNSYSITDCGLPGRVSHREIDIYFNTTISSYFSTGGPFKPKSDYEKSAQKKYELFGKNVLHQKFTFAREDVGRRLYTIDLSGTSEGRLVFTGQPGARQQKNGKWSGHHLEFIFFKGSVTKRVVPDSVMESFFFAYYEHDKPKWSEDWKVWRVKLEKGEEIPVFFHKNENSIKSLGLSYLYKLPYNNSVIDNITHHQGKAKLDLSEAIFGHIDKNNSLKGRVHIGHAFANAESEVDTEKSEVLSGPKASYYPNYIRQTIGENGSVKNYKTFMDDDAEIAGWKRYPIHANGVKQNPLPPNTNSEKILTKFIPLKAGAEFIFSIRYHNLRPVELGALLSALTFHETEETYHSIGMAKPLGYGKVSLKIENADRLDIPKYLCAFETYMNYRLSQTKPLWHKMDQVVELITMAQEHQDANLEYMSLDNYVLAKNEKNKDKTPKIKEALDKYTKLVSHKTLVSSFCDKNAITAMKSAFDKELRSYKHADNVDEVIEMNRRASIVAIREKFEMKKAQLLEELKVKQSLIAQKEQETKEAQDVAERERKNEVKRKRVQSSGPGFDKIDISNRRTAKDNLVKCIETFGKMFYMQNDIKKVILLNPSGYLPSAYHDDLIKTLHGIYAILPKNEKKKWDAPFVSNAILKKVAEWIGEEKAKAIPFNEI